MTKEPLDATDALIRRERRGIWLALIVIAALAAAALLEAHGPFRTAGRLLTLTAVAIPLGILLSAGRGFWTRRDALAASRNAIRHDESRRAAIDRASRYGFIGTLIPMSAYALLSQNWPLPVLPSMLLMAFVVLGVVVFLVTFLVLDRPT